MSTTVPPIDLSGLDVSDLDLWQDGPPHEVFADDARDTGLHWSPLDAFPRGVAASGRSCASRTSRRSGATTRPTPRSAASSSSTNSRGTPRSPGSDGPRGEHDDHARTRRATTGSRRSCSARSRPSARSSTPSACARSSTSSTTARSGAHPDGRIDLVQDVGIYVPVDGDRRHARRAARGRATARRLDQPHDRVRGPAARARPRRLWRALEEFMPYVNAMLEDARARSDGRPHNRVHRGRGRRGAPLARGGPDVLLPADGGRQRLHPRRLHERDQEPARGSRADGARALRRGAARAGRRGVRPLQPRLRLHAAHRNPRHRARGPARSAPGDKLALWYVSGNRDETRVRRARTASTFAASPTRTRASAAAGVTSASAPASPASSSSCGSRRRSSASRRSRSRALASASARPS